MIRLSFLLSTILLLNSALGSHISALHDEAEEEHHHESLALRVQKELEKKIVTNLTSNPDLKSFRPIGKGADGATEIQVNAHIRDVRITKVDTGLYDLTLNLVIRQMWNDPRLVYDASAYPGYKHFQIPGSVIGRIQHIWNSDLFFRHEIQGKFHYLLAPNSYAWLHPNGNIRYSERVSVTLPCSQPEEKDDERKELVCSLDLASYGYTQDQVHFSWTENPIQISENLYIPHYTIGEVTHENSVSTTRVGQFSGIKAKIHFVPK